MELTPQPEIAGAAAAPSARHADTADRLRRASLGSLLVLLVQYGLGMGDNLFVNVPAADQGVGVGKAFGKALSNGPAALATHAGIGVLLVVNVIVVLVFAVRARRTAVTVSSAVALLCVIGASFSGAAFVNDGTNSGANGASMTMAVLTGVALACYGINLYVLGSGRDR
jgi:hypothetical protein